MSFKRIVIDGKVYNSVEEMPEEVRRRYEQATRSLKDQDGNGIPDLFEGNNILADRNNNGIPDLVEHTPGERIVANSLKILFDGREFNSLDELPPEARAKYEKAMSALDANHNGMPDFLEGAVRVQAGAPSASTDSPANAAPFLARTSMPMETPTITPDRPNAWLLGVLAALLLFSCALGAVGGWYFFLR